MRLSDRFCRTVCHLVWSSHLPARAGVQCHADYVGHGVLSVAQKGKCHSV